jgi:hypothetical protein
MKALYEAFEELEIAVERASNVGSILNYSKLGESLQVATQIGNFNDEYETTLAYHDYLASKVSA